MVGKTHVAVAATTIIGIALTQKSIEIMGMDITPSFGLVTMSIGALLVDIDMEHSTMGRKYPIFSKIFTHRGMTHTGIVCLCWVFLFLAMGKHKQNAVISLAESLTWGFVVSYISHVVIDLFNGKGVPLFWPLSKRKVHVMKIVTKSIRAENNKTVKSKISEPLFLGSYIILVLIHVIQSLA